PGFGLREAAVLLSVPGEGSAGVVPAAQVDDVQGLGLAQALLQSAVVLVDAGNIVELCGAGPLKVDHAQLLPLVDEGGAPQEEVHRAQRLDGGGVVLGAAQILGGGPGLVVVL